MVRRIDRARTRAGREDVDAALGMWEGLVDGRWSLVDPLRRIARVEGVGRQELQDGQLVAVYAAARGELGHGFR